VAGSLAQDYFFITYSLPAGLDLEFLDVEAAPIVFHKHGEVQE
jgi:hypothetical protein